MNKGKQKKAVVVLWICIICIFGICGCGEKENEQTNSPIGQHTEESEKFNMVRDGYLAVETPYCILEYPESWNKYLKYERNTEAGIFVVTFFCEMQDDSIELFKICFGNGAEGELIGYWNDGDTWIEITIMTCDLASEEGMTEDDRDIVYTMAESVNDVVQSIRSSENFKESILGSASEYSENAESIKIETPYCTLAYPACWADYLEYEEDKEGDMFSETFYCAINNKKIELFAVCFGDSDYGIEIGYITVGDNKYVCSVESVEFIPDDSWTDAEIEIVYAMSECINYVIDSVKAYDQYATK